MVKILCITLIILMSVVLIRSNVVYAQGSSQTNIQQASDQNYRLLAAGAGAILGILFFNAAMAPFGSLPFATAPLAPNPYDIVVGSRIIAALTAGSGAILAHYLYHLL